MKRGKPLARKTRLARGKPIRRKAPRQLRREGSYPAYLEAVRGLPCCAARLGFSFFHCTYGDPDAHHAGKRPGTGLKCSDLEAIPLCREHHSAWHAGRPPFKNWTRPVRRLWADEQIAFTQAQLNHLVSAIKDGRGR